MCPVTTKYKYSAESSHWNPSTHESCVVSARRSGEGVEGGVVTSPRRRASGSDVTSRWVREAREGGGRGKATWPPPTALPGPPFIEAREIRSEISDAHTSGPCYLRSTSVADDGDVQQLPQEAEAEQRSRELGECVGTGVVEHTDRSFFSFRSTTHHRDHPPPPTLLLLLLQCCCY